MRIRFQIAGVISALPPPASVGDAVKSIGPFRALQPFGRPSRFQGATTSERNRYAVNTDDVPTHQILCLTGITRRRAFRCAPPLSSKGPLQTHGEVPQRGPLQGDVDNYPFKNNRLCGAPCASIAAPLGGVVRKWGSGVGDPPQKPMLGGSFTGGVTSSDRRSSGLCVARIVWVATWV